MKPSSGMRDFSFDAIGVVHSCFKQKFGIPRQPGLVDVPAVVELHGEYAREEAVRGLEAFSHIWVLFLFHQSVREDWKPTVRPPRLGGNERVGVFASRSMFRPNPIGLSVVELASIEYSPGSVRLHIRGGDLLDGTPVLDIKPYLPYADALPEARGGYAPASPEAQCEVRFTDAAEAALEEYGARLPELRRTIIALLQYDPRPAYQADTGQKQAFAMRLYDFDLKWRMEGECAVVYGLEPVGPISAA
jgi:tRNA-Thr(GGU) m(6)t(6)A37 methyltransferase TsaA